MRRNRKVKFVTQILVALWLVLSFFLLAYSPAANAVVTKVYAHGFSKDIDRNHPDWMKSPINVTDTFTQQDEVINHYISAAFPSPTNFTWRWYDPSGGLYSEDWWKIRCPYVSCFWWNPVPLKGHTDVASKLGQWRVDMYADGVLLYSDRFTITPVVVEELDQVFDVTGMHARVNMTVTIHPYHERWARWSFWMAERSENYTAYDAKSGGPLQVNFTKQSNSSLTWVNVWFNSLEGDGYRFKIVFDLLDLNFETEGNDYSVSWGWGTQINPIPVKVTVILPRGFEYHSVRGSVENVTTDIYNGRIEVSFAGVAKPNQWVQWTVTYTKAVAVTALETSSLTAKPPLQPVIGPTNLIYIVVTAGAVIVSFSTLLAIRKRRSAS